MVKVDIISGFLGAGKTTLIKKLLSDSYYKGRLAIVENEFGEVGIDGNELEAYGVSIKEINSGCICCSLAGDFSKALNELIDVYNPEQIVIEPSGVGKLSEVIEGCKGNLNIKLANIITIVDGTKYFMHKENFGDFYVDQITNARRVVISRVSKLSLDDLDNITKDIKKLNPSASLASLSWEDSFAHEIIDGGFIDESEKVKSKKCGCGCKGGHHHHHHHVHAEEVFDVYGDTTNDIFCEEDIRGLYEELEKGSFGKIIRAKGLLRGESAGVRFSYVPGELEINQYELPTDGRVVFIGVDIDKDSLNKYLARKRLEL